MSERKALIALRGSMRADDSDHLFNLGYDVTWVDDIDGIKSLGHVALRDYFAAFALEGLIINPATVSVHCPISARAYELANAMLAEREKP